MLIGADNNPCMRLSRWPGGSPRIRQRGCRKERGRGRRGKLPGGRGAVRRHLLRLECGGCWCAGRQDAGDCRKICSCLRPAIRRFFRPHLDSPGCAVGSDGRFEPWRWRGTSEAKMGLLIYPYYGKEVPHEHGMWVGSAPRSDHIRLFDHRDGRGVARPDLAAGSGPVPPVALRRNPSCRLHPGDPRSQFRCPGAGSRRWRCWRSAFRYRPTAIDR